MSKELDTELPADVLEQIEAGSKSAPEDRHINGPLDAAEVQGIRPYVDLGSIKVVPREGLQLRLEVDERQQVVAAVTIEFEGSLLQAQAFAAPKSTGLWHGMRTEAAAQLRSQGAKTREIVGPLGVELQAVSEVQTPDGEQGVQVLRVVGVDGPRWLLRGTLLGEAAVDDAARDRLLEIFREMVVVRGESPMPPGDLLPLQVPAGAVPQGGPAGAGEA